MGNYRAQLHHCVEGKHWHFLTGMEVPSWPFWSLEIGLRLADFMAEHMAEGEEDLRRIQELKEELRTLSRTNLRGPRGLYSGLVLPRKMRDWEAGGKIAEKWATFFREQLNVMEFILWQTGGATAIFSPCTFIHRTPKKPPFASPRTVREAGIELQTR